MCVKVVLYGVACRVIKVTKVFKYGSYCTLACENTYVHNVLSMVNKQVGNEALAK